MKKRPENWQEDPNEISHDDEMERHVAVSSEQTLCSLRQETNGQNKSKKEGAV